MNPGFSAKISSLFYELMSSDIAVRLPEADQNTQNQVYHFLAGGCGNLIVKRIEGGSQMNRERLAEEVENMCNVFVNAYREHLSGQRNGRL